MKRHDILSALRLAVFQSGTEIRAIGFAIQTDGLSDLAREEFSRISIDRRRLVKECEALGQLIRMGSSTISIEE